ncbi:hypothetical protein D3C81_1978900 [compost metagenome]
MNIGSRDQIVRGVLECAVAAFDVRVDEIKQTVIIAETRSPYPAGPGITQHVKLRNPCQRMTDQLPVHKIPGMMNLYARKPLEGGGRDIVVGSDP